MEGGARERGKMMRDASEIRTSGPAMCLCGKNDFEALMQTTYEPLAAIVRCTSCGDVFLARDKKLPVLLDTRLDKRI